MRLALSGERFKVPSCNVSFNFELMSICIVYELRDHTAFITSQVYFHNNSTSISFWGNNNSGALHSGALHYFVIPDSDSCIR